MSSEYRWLTFEEWKDYGINRGYETKSPVSFQKSKSVTKRQWYQKGIKRGWHSSFNFQRKRLDGMWQTKEEWRTYGINRGYENRILKSLQKSDDTIERSWLNRGRHRGWHSSFNFKNKRVIGMWKSKKEWIQYGLKHSYEERNPNSFYKSKNKTERSWISKGQIQNWLPDFNFTKLREDGMWQTKEEWTRSGIEHAYNEHNANSLRRGEDKLARSWYSKGMREGWLKEIKLEKKILYLEWETKEEWIKQGIENGYERRSKVSFEKSDDKNERAWLRRGRSQKWINDFNFQRLRLDKRWETFEEWNRYGIKNGYEDRNVTSLINSNDKEERSWCIRGRKKKWTNDFNFKIKTEHWRWRTLDEWIEYGISNNYQTVNPGSFQHSKDKTRRSWYHKGQKEKWLPQFTFSRLHNDDHSINSGQHSLLEVYINNSSS